MTQTIATRLAAAGLTLPDVSAPTANYLPVKIAGQLALVSGQIPRLDGTVLYRGKVGDGISLDEARAAARICALNAVAQLNLALDGDLERVAGCLRLRGFVNAVPAFAQHAEVIDAASDVLVEVFGTRGRHVRTAIGAGSLPRNVAVEIDADFELHP